MRGKGRTGHHGGSGPTKASGHIDSVMGRQYPAGMAVRGKSVGFGTARKGKRGR